MQGTHFEFQDPGNEMGGSYDGTPTTIGLARLPKLRLLDRILKSEGCVTSGIINSRSPPATLPSRTSLKHPRLFHKSISTADRFIGSRNKYSIEAASYLLTKQPANVVESYELDVLKEVDMLPVKWRKDLMHNAMVKENVIPGLGQKSVLHQTILPPTECKGMLMEDYYKSGMWRSRPRKRPLITSAGTVLDMPHSHRCTLLTRNQIDWSSRNVFANAIHEKVTLFDITQPELVKILPNRSSEKVYALKWNNAGDHLVMFTLLFYIKLYNAELNKIVWITMCPNEDEISSAVVYIRCFCWSPDDKSIAVGCKWSITIYCAKTGHMIRWVEAHNDKILAIAISSNSRYIVSTSEDKVVRIFTWPELQPVFDIVYNYPATGLAWNPLNSNMLCIGGGLADASLSLWDMTTKDVISYRVVDFFGSINQLAWNKISGELVVQWSCIDEDGELTIMPVLSSLDRIVDKIPVAKTLVVHAIMWNADHSQLAVCNQESLSIWNFFGDEFQYRHTCKKQVSKDSRKNTRHEQFSSIHHTIR